MTGSRDGTSSLLDQRNTYAHAHGVVRPAPGGRATPTSAPSEVRVGQTDTPYWQAGDALLPYGKDWFTTGVLEVEGNRREGGLGGL